MRNLILTHGFWAIAMVTAFFVGMGWQRSATADRQKSEIQNQASRGQFTLSAPSETGMTRTTSNRTDSGESGPIPKLIQGTSFVEMGIESLAAMSLKDPNQLKRRLAFSHLLS